MGSRAGALQQGLNTDQAKLNQLENELVRMASGKMRETGEVIRKTIGQVAAEMETLKASMEAARQELNTIRQRLGPRGSIGE